jgi:hypothetical protein
MTAIDPPAREEEHLTCGITLWGPNEAGHVMPVKLCGKSAVGVWEHTPICEEHLAQHSDAHRGF